ncbi:MAG: EscU/YscU/HrcU family type III secretion system export apparatus switch protein [Gemmatimonadales bacterium]|nr:MAG: EscU/YscU/HrcU family type III secretion system export apparatus switch protein [Gemmatimonadales bacterium]
MSDESPHDKPHAPTPKRIDDAKQKGQVPKSTELNAAVLLLASALVVAVAGVPISRGLLEIYGETLARATAPPEGARATAVWLQSLGWKVLGILTPVMLFVLVMALLVAGAQGRGSLSVDPITPKLEKLDPIKKAKQIWGWQAVMELGKSLVKMIIVGVAVTGVLYVSRNRIPELVQVSPLALLELIRGSALRMLLFAGGAYIFLALADYAFQVWQHERGLRMSQEELKRENKESDGDPHVRARRLSMGRSLARRRMMLSVSDADVVLVNPVHVAVALKWDPEVAPAPIVLAMGTRKLALLIRERARDAGVPIVENPPLARALLAAGKVGHPVPVEFYVLVAEVLAFVFRERARKGKPWAGSRVA